MNDITGALGMCVRSRNCSFGFEKIIKDIKKGKTFLVLLSDKASETTKKRIRDKCKFYKIEIIELEIDDVLESLNLNMNIKVISINDINFKKLIIKQLKGDT